ncbi:MAG: anthranilate synthase component I family protein [Brumimicrobium sp.]|nr:anthranilate synthase component I family protein [Brumimicrobium sp.]
MKVISRHKSFNADTYNPVGIYLSIRDKYRKPCLLESNDYHDRSDSKSMIGFEPLAEIKIENGRSEVVVAEETIYSSPFNRRELPSELKKLIELFDFEEPDIPTGFFTYAGFETASYLEKKVLNREKECALPDVHLILYKFLIVLDHFNDEGMIIENSFDEFSSNFDDLLHTISFRNYPDYPFEIEGDESARTPTERFKETVKKGIDHVIRGDVFQIVLSRRFSQRFRGEDFQVYRQLRRTNPSPYLFYFDYETHRLFGSSPEAQLIVKSGVAEIHPIAGTVRKTGNAQEDQEKIDFLKQDEKENSEHIMLVDLARNDLSKYCHTVRVDRLREIQSFSHVIHLVSRITGKLDAVNPAEIFLQTFPAGTLSGAPKPKALELISKYEDFPREFYGGSVGFLAANGDLNTAIIIRSCISQNNVLHYQAGAGIVLDSDPEKECEEVDNKLRAIREAIKQSQTQQTLVS